MDGSRFLGFCGAYPPRRAMTESAFADTYPYIPRLFVIKCQALECVVLGGGVAPCKGKAKTTEKTGRSYRVWRMAWPAWLYIEYGESRFSLPVSIRVGRLSLRVDRRGREWKAAQRSFDVGAAERRSLARGRQLGADAAWNRNPAVGLVDRRTTWWTIGAPGYQRGCDSFGRTATARRSFQPCAARGAAVDRHIGQPARHCVYNHYQPNLHGHRFW
mgnify:CR=1 FL=1